MPDTSDNDAVMGTSLLHHQGSNGGLDAASAAVPTTPHILTRTRDEYELDQQSDAQSPSAQRPPKLARTSSHSTNSSSVGVSVPDAPSSAQDPIVNELLDQLECGMCSAVFIDPVALNDCGHLFCGSCVTLWLKSLPSYLLESEPGDPVPKPIACPYCRYAPILTATPCRVAQTMVDVLVARRPDVAREPNEIRQAREVYPTRTVIKFALPPPPPLQDRKSDFYQPCPSCYPTEEGQWRCPHPVPRWEVPEERALCVIYDGDCPDGHRLCSDCGLLAPCYGPFSIVCGLCEYGYCGNPTTGCDCEFVSQSEPTPRDNDLIQLLEGGGEDIIMTVFSDNWTEMRHLRDYLNSGDDSLEPQAIYHSILDWLRSPEGVAKGGVLGLLTRSDTTTCFRDRTGDQLQAGIMPPADGQPEGRVCGSCADIILYSGLFEWWQREQKKEGVWHTLPESMRGRPNCKLGRKCTLQHLEAHANKYNHVCDEIDQNGENESSSIGDSSTSSVDDSDEEEDHDEPATLWGIDTAVQYEDHPEGSVVTRISSGIRAVWKAHLNQGTFPLLSAAVSGAGSEDVASIDSANPLWPAVGMPSHLVHPPSLESFTHPTQSVSPIANLINDPSASVLGATANGATASSYHGAESPFSSIGLAHGHQDCPEPDSFSSLSPPGDLGSGQSNWGNSSNMWNGNAM